MNTFLEICKAVWTGFEYVIIGLLALLLAPAVVAICIAALPFILLIGFISSIFGTKGNSE